MSCMVDSSVIIRDTDRFAHEYEIVNKYDFSSPVRVFRCF